MKLIRIYTNLYEFTQNYSNLLQYIHIFKKFLVLFKFFEFIRIYNLFEFIQIYTNSLNLFEII